MNDFDRVLNILNDKYSTDTVLAFATSTDDRIINIREVDFFYHDEHMYCTTWKKSTKVKEISQNNNVALNKDMFKIIGTAENLGGIFDEGNEKIHELIKDKFSHFYDHHIGDYSAILKIKINEATVYDDDHLYTADFTNRTCQRLEKPDVL